MPDKLILYDAVGEEGNYLSFQCLQSPIIMKLFFGKCPVAHVNKYNKIEVPEIENVTLK